MRQAAKWRLTAIGLFFALAALVSLGRAADPPKANVDEKSQAVLDAFGTYSKGLQGFKFDVSTAMNMQQGEMKESQTLTQKIAFERPNKFLSLLDSPLPGAGSIVVSDGTNMMVSIMAFDMYAVEKTPEDWANPISNPVAFGAMAPGNAAVIFFAMVDRDPAVKLLENIKTVKYVGQEKVDEFECHHLRADGDQVSWDIWISTGQQALVRRLSPDVNKIFAALKDNPDLKELADLPGLADMKMTITVDLKPWEVNPKFPADAFALTPPQGAKKVDTFMDIMSGMMQVMPGQAPGPHPLVGKPAPQVDVDLFGGGKLDLASLKNKNVVILDFWASWCGPCRAAMPTIEKVAREFETQGVKLFAVNMQEDGDTIREFQDESKLAVTVAMDKDGAVAKSFLVSGIPQTVLVGKDGSVQVVKIGNSPTLEADLRRDLQALVAGQDLAAEEIADFEKKKADGPVQVH